MNIKDRILKTEVGYNYIKVTPKEVFNWGGACICNSCNKQFAEDMYLVYSLTDTYCDKCFNEWVERTKKMSNEDIEYDLKKQENYSYKWYKNLLERGNYDIKQMEL